MGTVGQARLSGGDLGFTEGTDYVQQVGLSDMEPLARMEIYIQADTSFMIREIRKRFILKVVMVNQVT